jgi:hypothetical protein
LCFEAPIFPESSITFTGLSAFAIKIAECIPMDAASEKLIILGMIISVSILQKYNKYQM